MRTAITVIAVLALVSVHRAPCEVRLSQQDRQGELDWLSTFGLKIPAGGPLLEDPFGEPFTRRSLLVPATWWRQGPQERVPAAQLRSDLPLLRAVMEKAYGGWESAEQRGWNWDAWFEGWDQHLAAAGDSEIALRDALAPLGRLMDFQLDNHTGFTGPIRFGGGSRTAVLAERPGGACTEMKDSEGRTFALNVRDPAQAPKAASIVEGSGTSGRQGYYFSYPSRRGTAAAIHCGEKWLPVHTTWLETERTALIAEMAGKPADQPSYRQPVPAIGYLRLPTFTKPNTEAFRKLLPTLPDSAGHEKLLILDLRGNHGGDNVLKELSRWIDLDALRPALRHARHTRNSCLYDALRWGYMQYTLLPVKAPISNELTGVLQRGLNAVFTPSPPGCPVSMEHIRAEWDYTRHRFSSAPRAGKPRLLLLIDNTCGSDCEYTTYILAAIPGSIIAGENTYGVCQFIQPGYFVLPHSRVPFRIALGMSAMYGDGRSVDGYGLDVDIVLADKAAQSPTGILRLAKQYAEAGVQ